MCEITIDLTTDEKRRLDLAAAALGKTPAQLVSDELRSRYGVLQRISDVSVVGITEGAADGHH